MNTKAVGDTTEAVILAALVRAGYIVLIPFGDNQRYDLALDLDGAILRIQCKTAKVKNAILTFQSSSSYAHRGRSQRGYRGEADVFGVYAPEVEQIYMIPVNEVGETSVVLRLRPALNNQSRRVRYAKQYTFENWIANNPVSPKGRARGC